MGASSSDAGPSDRQFDRPPRTLMRIEGGEQRGRVYRQDWAQLRHGICRRLAIDGPYPVKKRALEVAPGTKRVRIIFRTPLRPRELSFKAWRAADRDAGTVVGPAEEPDYKLKRVDFPSSPRHDWRAILNVDLPVGHYYLSVFGRWRDSSGCGSQQATWGFHFRTPRPIEAKPLSR